MLGIQVVLHSREPRRRVLNFCCRGTVDKEQMNRLRSMVVADLLEGTMKIVKVVAVRPSILRCQQYVSFKDLPA